MVKLKANSSFAFRRLQAFFSIEAGLARRHDRTQEASADHVQATPQNSGRVEELGEVSRKSMAPLTKPEPRKATVEEQYYGVTLRPGDPHYRAYVGPPKDYDLIAVNQTMLLMAAGLRETHRLVDVGCGSLRAGRLFIPYLRPGHYFGIEPNKWLVEEGIKRELGSDIVKVKRPTFRFVEDFSLSAFGVDFDFAVAQSVFSHTYPGLALTGLRRIAEVLAPSGKLFATFIEGEPTVEGSGWVYPGCVSYTWEKMQNLVEESGLVARRVDWRHPRQSWFVAAHPNIEDEIDDLSRRLRPPLQR